MFELFALADGAAASDAATAGFAQFLLLGLVNGSLYALVALGYTMVYGIIELINFAHGDLFMLGTFLALSVAAWWFEKVVGPPTGTTAIATALLLMILVTPLFCAALNVAVDRVFYKPLRNSPKLTVIVTAIGVSFVFMNIGSLWKGSSPVDFPDLIPNTELFPNSGVRFTWKDAMVIGVTVPVMVALTFFVRFTSLGKAMRATAQNPTAAQLMGINVDRVISLTFAIGGALAGIGAVITGLYNTSSHYQIGFQFGLYAFTAAVLGGIGNIPGAVLGGIVIGLVGELAKAYLGMKWSEAVVFTILIVILVFRPAGLLGARTREKV